MDFDSNAYYKLCSPDREDRYNEIIKAIHLLQHKHDNETPEMWCSRICGPFRKILEENPDIHGFLIRRHGMYTWGKDLTEAARHVEILEFLLESVGRRQMMEPQY